MVFVKNDVGEYLYLNYKIVVKVMDYFIVQIVDFNFLIIYVLSYGFYFIVGFIYFIVYKINMIDCFVVKEFV